MTLTAYGVEEDPYSVFVLCLSFEYANEAFEWAGIDPDPLSWLEFLVPADESILPYLCLEETDYILIDRNRTATETDYVLHTPGVIDVMKLLIGIKSGKYIIRE